MCVFCAHILMFDSTNDWQSAHKRVRSIRNFHFFFFLNCTETNFQAHAHRMSFCLLFVAYSENQHHHQLSKRVADISMKVIFYISNNAVIQPNGLVTDCIQRIAHFLFTISWCCVMNECGRKVTTDRQRVCKANSPHVYSPLFIEIINQLSVFEKYFQLFSQTMTSHSFTALPIDSDTQMIIAYSGLCRRC